MQSLHGNITLQLEFKILNVKIDLIDNPQNQFRSQSGGEWFEVKCVFNCEHDVAHLSSLSFLFCAIRDEKFELVFRYQLFIYQNKYQYYSSSYCYFYSHILLSVVRTYKKARPQILWNCTASIVVKFLSPKQNISEIPWFCLFFVRKCGQKHFA